jgi:hypothetical protein
MIVILSMMIFKSRHPRWVIPRKPNRSIHSNIQVDFDFGGNKVDHCKGVEGGTINYCFMGREEMPMIGMKGELVP